LLIDKPVQTPSQAFTNRHPVWASLICSVLIVLIFRTLAVREYRSATA
jgi:ABC-2 type transport system permease protein